MKNLLVPVDFSEVTERVVDAAERIALAFGAKVWLMHCVAENKSSEVSSEDQVVNSNSADKLPERFPDEHGQLEKLTKSLRNDEVEAEAVFVSGTPVDEIMAAADRYSADLIIVGSHGHGVLYELLVGTVAKFVLLRSGRPTLIVPSRRSKAEQPSIRQRKKREKVGHLEFTKPEFFGLHD